MKTEFVFNTYEHVLLARYHRDIKLTHKDVWRSLSTQERNSICRTKAMLKRYAAMPNTASRLVWTDAELLRCGNLQKLIEYFPILKSKLKENL